MSKSGAITLGLMGAAALWLGTAAAAPSPARIQVILVGDSTMAKSSGYGDALCGWFKPDVTCSNVAKGGRSSRTYRDEGSWAKVMEMLASKDNFTQRYVLIQFGHNDQPGKPERSTTLPEFSANMAGYVKDVRSAGATPVLVTPLTRRQFKDGKLLEDLAPWAEATRKVAAENKVSLLDLNHDSVRAVQKLGPAKANELAEGPPPPAVVAAALTGTTIEVPHPPDGSTLRAAPASFDYTHLGAAGGDFFAAILVRDIRESVKPLAAHLSAKAPKPSDKQPREISVWRGKPPGGENVTVTQTVIERSKTPDFHDRALIGITQPTLTIYKPEKPDGSAVLVIPGGAYLRVVVDKEGEETARRLNARGITAAVLVYRLPADGWAARRDAPLQDAQRAIRLLRSGIAGPVDPKRIGVLGFSAGGDLAAALTLRHEAKLYEPFDQADLLSARPDFSVLMYPALNMTVRPENGEPVPATTPLDSLVTETAPPVFIIHAADDPTVSVDLSLKMFSALKAAKVPAEMHIFEEGGHGFGVRLAAGKPVEAWPDLLVTWGTRHKFFTGTEALSAKR